eukprot:TRINITY_DN578_c0_g2_i1.p1 TRINITY_DN578_c0_g2~~TRINITY_DN578_c0_g2_i1.p1  ORF type:complete len:455 (+),score=70.84 TRINITY_DN578_c0_g2_i1:48-1412(+)
MTQNDVQDSSSSSGTTTSQKVFTTKLIAATTIGLYKTAVGTGVLSVPKALANSGLVMFPLLLGGFSVLAHYGCWLVAKTLDIIGQKDMDPAKVGEYAGGKAGKYLTVLLCLLDPWGSTVAFFSTLSDIIRPILETHTLFGEGTVWTSHGFVVMCLAALVFPLMLSTKISEINWVNTLGVVSLIAFTVGLLVNMVQHNKGLSGAPLGEASNDAVVALSVVAFAYDGCQLNVFPFYRDLPEVGEGEWKGDKMAMICGLANYSGALSYFLVAMLGYATYRDDTDDDILNNFGNSSPVYVTIKVTFAVSLLLTIPLTLFECAAVLREHVFGDSRARNIALNFALIASAAFIASFVPNMYAAFSYVGATTATAWTTILPPMWYIFTVKRAYKAVDEEDDDEEASRSSIGINADPEELADLLHKNRNLPPKPSNLQLTCAWVFMICGCCAVPFFLYSTAV